MINQNPKGLKNVTCAFTGHRPIKYPWRYHEEDPNCINLKRRLENEMLRLIEIGVTTFLSGMAEGTDTWGALTVLNLRKTYPYLKLVCVLPCEDQAARWSEHSKKCYFSILEQADEIIYTGRDHTKTCMMERNRFLVDHATYLLAVYNGEKQGGTAATVRYAKKQARTIIILDPNEPIIKQVALSSDLFHW
ncbi:MAG: SLOG family protein [Evtepia sp.]